MEQERKGNILIEAIREIYTYREMLFSLAYRNIKVHYKQTFLGVAWAIFTPLATMLIFAFVNKTKIININSGDIPYPIYAYCGVLPWTFFSSSLISATTSLPIAKNLIDKIYFPREIIPLSEIISKLFNLFVASLVLVGLIIFYKIKLHITVIAVPLILLVQIIFIAGLSFYLSVAHLFYRDVGYIMGGTIPLLMFVTSVVYPIKVGSQRLQALLMTVNPMTPLIDAYRDLIIEGKWPDWSMLSLPIWSCCILFITGIMWFHKMENLFSENI